MASKGSEILNKLISAAMIIGSMAFFADAPHAPLYIVPGILFGGAGFVLALRRDRKAAAELELQQRVNQLAEGLAATQAEVGAAQAALERLREERDFMRQLVPVVPPVAAPPVPPPLPRPMADRAAATAPEVPRSER